VVSFDIVQKENNSILVPRRLQPVVTGTMAAAALDEELARACEQLLASNAWQSAHTTRIDGLKKRLKMLPAAGLPRMRVLPNVVLERLGRIPRSTEGHQVDALEAVERKGADRLNNPRAVLLVRLAVL